MASVSRSVLRAEPRRGWAFAVLAYLGGIALLALAVVRALLVPRRGAARLLPIVVRRLDEMLLMGLVLVALVSAPMGSFLAMQAFFLATFREASGAVVGLGLVRNLAPLLTGLVLAGMLATRIVPELRRRPWTGLDDDPHDVPDRDVAAGRQADPRIEPTPGQLAAVRVVAAVLAGPILTIWGTVVGFGMGMFIARGFLSVSPGIYVNKFLEMLEFRDPLGLAFKSLVFPLIAALVACHEGLRGDDDPRLVPMATWRALTVSIVGMLMVNDAWFTLSFLSGSPFGPAVSSP